MVPVKIWPRQLCWRVRVLVSRFSVTCGCRSVDCSAFQALLGGGGTVQTFAIPDGDILQARLSDRQFRLKLAEPRGVFAPLGRGPEAAGCFEGPRCSSESSDLRELNKRQRSEPGNRSGVRKFSGEAGNAICSGRFA